ncbi:putative ribonuclease H-like domain-containing protein, partial [Tanacetum coccineum]
MADFNNMDNTIAVSPIPTLKIHKDHPKGKILGDPTSAVQIRGKIQKAFSVQQAFKNPRLYHKTANLDFDDVYFVDELKFNLFSVLQMCDKKNSVIFTETECLILSPSFKLLYESQVVLKAPRKDDVYNLDLKNIVPSGGITCLYANATADESKLWHMRLSHVNFKNINKLVKGHLVRGLPSKVFMNDHTCVACKKGKQHKASCTIDKTLFIKKNKSDIMLVQVYVDDIIFGSTKKSMCTEFEDCMHKRFQMSSMGELTFFLELQVKQQPDGIFISQDKYVADILKKFEFWSIRTATTPIESNKPLVKDEDGEDVD